MSVASDLGFVLDGSELAMELWFFRLGMYSDGRWLGWAAGDLDDDSFSEIGQNWL